MFYRLSLLRMLPMLISLISVSSFMIDTPSPGIPFFFLFSYQNTSFPLSVNLNLNLATNLSLDASGILLVHFSEFLEQLQSVLTSSRKMHLFPKNIFSVWSLPDTVLSIQATKKITHEIVFYLI